MENGEFHTKLFENRDNFDFDIVTALPFHCSNVPRKMLHGTIKVEFPKISRVSSKIEDVSRICKQLKMLLIRTKWAKEGNQSFLDKNDPTAPRRFSRFLANQLRK